MWRIEKFLLLFFLLFAVSLSFAQIQNDSTKNSQQEGNTEKQKGFPVIGLMSDTLFYVHSKIGSFSPEERALHIGNRIKDLYEKDDFKLEYFQVVKSDLTVDVVYGDLILVGVTHMDAEINGKSQEEIAERLKLFIYNYIKEVKEKRKISNYIWRGLLGLLVVAIAVLIFHFINKLFIRFRKRVETSQLKWLHDLKYRDYTFLNIKQELELILIFLKIAKWAVFIILGYIALSLFFSIFILTQDWSEVLFDLIWSPFKFIFISIWEFLPNLITILAIILVMRYFIKFIRYIFSEIELGKLKISGFHQDWAMPTFGIIRLLLLAFTIILIFPYLPGSESGIFRGVSVFIGILFSLGSSSAIANLIAGLVITYMRPFKIGDRIKIGDNMGIVIDKTVLVTKLKTLKNEEITIPNSTVLLGNTVNYSTFAAEDGVMVHTTVTIGYDVPWRDMHNALIEAAMRTGGINKHPKPFVLQTALEDFYVAYQILGYTHLTDKWGIVQSELHQNIQDVCNEKGIEIMSPHYRAARDGNMSTIPSQYLPKDYKPQGFQVNVDHLDKSKNKEAEKD
ncbi:mechanosensitive ion channel family protein [Shivajiella indica]|uniref:Mechanosensitive ion channel family protein n=1 Tax=Shivajiella indica TaxID=872115 RepID=A0ABW5BDI6_9BACT